MQGQGGDRTNPQNAGCIGVPAAAALVSSTPSRIERARTIVKADAELAEQVMRGEKTKGQALKQIREREKTIDPPTDPDQADDANSFASSFTGPVNDAVSAVVLYMECI